MTQLTQVDDETAEAKLEAIFADAQTAPAIVVLDRPLIMHQGVQPARLSHPDDLLDGAEFDPYHGDADRQLAWYDDERPED